MKIQFFIETFRNEKPTLFIKPYFGGEDDLLYRLLGAKYPAKKEFAYKLRGLPRILTDLPKDISKFAKNDMEESKFLLYPSSITFAELQDVDREYYEICGKHNEIFSSVVKRVGLLKDSIEPYQIFFWFKES